MLKYAFSHILVFRKEYPPPPPLMDPILRNLDNNFVTLIQAFHYR